MDEDFTVLDESIEILLVCSIVNIEVFYIEPITQVDIKRIERVL